MRLAYVCLLLACALPVVCAGIAKSGRIGKPLQEGGYDNRDPRAWLARQAGFRARANAAQANSFEALPLFIAAVLSAIQMGAPAFWVDALAAAFIGMRVLYIAAYLSDRDLLRTFFWLLAVACCVALFFCGV